MKKDFHVIFPPYMQKFNTEWNMNIMGWVCGFLSHLSKSRCVRKLESCARFSPFRGVCPVVELTGLGSLCLIKSGGVPRMCVGRWSPVKQVVISEKFQLIKDTKSWEQPLDHNCNYGLHSWHSKCV